MSSTFADIENILNTRLSLCPDLPTVAYPSEGKNPDQNISFVRPTLMPATTVLNTLDNGEAHKGIYQIDVFTATNVGVYSYNNILDNLQDHFKAQRVLQKNSTTIVVQAITKSVAQRVDSWYSGYLEINYICYV